LREIADGLSYAHGKGVLHCDLKPANVLLDHSLRPRLADFGQSRMSDDQTPSLGTLFFMAPEQADLAAIPDASWDVYALGAIAYTMLVGSPPYRTADAVEQLETARSLPERLQRYRAMLKSASRPRLHYRRRGVDKRLCQLIDRCLSPDASQRYRNVQQLIGAIDHRQQARSRRPLMLMMVLGPLLLLGLLFWFAAVTTSIAKRESLEQVQQLALRGNSQTAKYAKSTMEGEIRELFQLIEREAARPQLAEALVAAVAANETTLQQIASTSERQTPSQEFIEQTERLQLNQTLDASLQAMIAREGSNQDVAIFNTLLINETRGTNMAMSLADSNEPLNESPVGRNFAYRSYFNGLREDGDRTQRPLAFAPLRQPHLSASFRSTSTGKWKIGVSAPIWPTETAQLLEQGITPGDDVQPLGVLVLTVNLGDFVLLGGVAADENQFTTLVDGRAGTQQGTLLQHPLIAAMDRPTMLASSMPQIDPRLLDRLWHSDGIVDFIDPASKFPGGEEFQGTWLAAMAEVELPRSRVSQPGAEAENRAATSDLWVLVQQRSSAVSAPIHELGNRLEHENAKALAALLAMIVALWYFGLRFGQEGPRWWYQRREILPRAFAQQDLPHSALESTSRSDR
jgi:serine/threonine protein kinase